jgi:hypothetical protein
LKFVAVLSSQEGILFGCFDTFGDHRQPECLAHADDGFSNRPVLAAGLEIADERPVDLDGVDRKFFL